MPGLDPDLHRRWGIDEDSTGVIGVGCGRVFENASGGEELYITTLSVGSEDMR